jgi:hypothetical protein
MGRHQFSHLELCVMVVSITLCAKTIFQVVIGVTWNSLYSSDDLKWYLLHMVSLIGNGRCLRLVLWHSVAALHLER